MAPLSKEHKAVKALFIVMAIASTLPHGGEYASQSLDEFGMFDKDIDVPDKNVGKMDEGKDEKE